MAHSVVAVAVALICEMGLSPVRAQETAPPAAATAPMVLENTGKPMVVPFQCTDDDIRSGGLSCSEEEPCAVFLELTAAGAAGTRVFAIGNLHTEAVTLYSVLLASEDGGHTWTEGFERIRAAGLDRMQFHAERGWISGEELSPLPQNPFLLATNDGGKTWSRRPILNEADENRFGTVQQFAFGANDVGSLIVDRGQGNADRYVLYESPDGGDTWQIRQESRKPLTLKTAPGAPAADWRIHVDAASKAYRIERRQGEKWSLVAAFLVRVPPCKPPRPVENGEEKAEPVKPPIKKQPAFR